MEHHFSGPFIGRVTYRGSCRLRVTNPPKAPKLSASTSLVYIPLMKFHLPSLLLCAAFVSRLKPFQLSSRSAQPYMHHSTAVIKVLNDPSPPPPCSYPPVTKQKKTKESYKNVFTLSGNVRTVFVYMLILKWSIPVRTEWCIHGMMYP